MFCSHTSSLLLSSLSSRAVRCVGFDPFVDEKWPEPRGTLRDWHPLIPGGFSLWSRGGTGRLRPGFHLVGLALLWPLVPKRVCAEEPAGLGWLRSVGHGQALVSSALEALPLLPRPVSPTPGRWEPWGCVCVHPGAPLAARLSSSWCSLQAGCRESTCAPGGGGACPPALLRACVPRLTFVMCALPRSLLSEHKQNL